MKRTLSGVLNAWANNAQDGGALRAQQIMDRTESRSIEERGFAHSIVCTFYFKDVSHAW